MTSVCHFSLTLLTDIQAREIEGAREKDTQTKGWSWVTWPLGHMAQAHWDQASSSHLHRYKSLMSTCAAKASIPGASEIPALKESVFKGELGPIAMQKKKKKMKTNFSSG